MGAVSTAHVNPPVVSTADVNSPAAIRYFVEEDCTFFNAGNQRCLSDSSIVVYNVEIKPFRDFDEKSSWISLDSFDFNGFYYWKE